MQDKGVEIDKARDKARDKDTLVAPGLPALHRAAKPLWYTGPGPRARKGRTIDVNAETLGIPFSLHAPFLRDAGAGTARVAQPNSRRESATRGLTPER